MTAVADTKPAEDALGARMIRRLVLPLALLTFVNAIDRVNVSFAAHAMGPDIGLSSTTFGLGVSAFFVAYLIFQYPHAALLRRFGIRRWLLVTVMLWGVAGLLLARVNTVGEFLAARFLLGMAEAGFAPGVTWFINRWLPVRSRAKAMATVLAAVPFSLVIGGPLCGWMLGLANPADMAAWRWMFLLQAIPNFLLAVAAYFYFRDSVTDSQWLNDNERALLAPAAEALPAEPITVALRDPRVWRCAITWLFVMTGSYALLFWLPQMVRQMNIGGTEFLIGTYAALPQAGLVVGMLVNGWLSDRSGERRWHVGVPAMLAGAAMLAGGLLPPGWAALGLLTVAGFGIGAAQSVFWAVPASMGIGNGRISVAAIAFISMLGTAGGIIGPTLIGMVRDATGSFVPSLVILSLLLVAGGLVIAPLTRKAA
ncbi:MFS transporter [Sphingomonas sp. G-3-2-10]|uniref:MFS transporter n=1 Tax=Sphingomonas sp. G-3-2-10 TaxID=2728838 RepID=UPI00146B75DE|nr:MFS transporter [Sphingomonas sp. G-3-2-10]NML07462.1 MFS transporter [Sphingomonas sp. G-3-2-10]